MDATTGRRRFLELAGTGTVLSVAGCNALQSDGTTTDDDIEGRVVAVQVQPGQEAQADLQARQREIQGEVQSGNLSQQEAREEIQTLQQEALAEGIDSFRSRSDELGVTVEDSLDQFGVLLISGSADSLLDALETDEVGAMFPQETFEEAKAQAGGAGTP